MQSQTEIPASVLVRDLFIFHFKLVLDGVKGFAMVWLSVTAVVVDLLLGGPDRGRYFYAVLRLGERLDLWLNLYAPSRSADSNSDGIFGESRAGESTFVGRMEEWVRTAEPTTPAPTA